MNASERVQSVGSIPAYDAIVIGAGFGGLYALYHLRDEMGLSVRAFDGASDVGGTWWYNRYPGARVDAPSSPFYAYTFSQELVDEWVWPETQSTQADVLAYVEHVADRFDLRKDIQFDTFVTDARYDEDLQRWTIETDGGEQATARFLICAVGALFVANKPDYPGIDDFTGDVHHTGRWPHEPVSFEGKRVGVIGTGSSGVQSIPQIAKTADHVTVFQRTPQYALPARNRPLPEEDLEQYRKDWDDLRASMRRRGGWPFPTSKLRAADHTFEERRQRYEEMWERGGIHLAINSFAGVYSDEELNEEIAEFVRNKIRDIVEDPETAREADAELCLRNEATHPRQRLLRDLQPGQRHLGRPARRADRNVQRDRCPHGRSASIRSTCWCSPPDSTRSVARCSSSIRRVEAGSH